MIPGFIDKLEFENVSLSPGLENWYIRFSLKNYNYSIKLSKKELFPIGVVHRRNKDLSMPKCQYCDAYETFAHVCLEFSKYANEIYEKLKKHPSIRLELLFLR
jgi:hypothetical protein